MPPKAKFTREEIITAPFDIVCRDGMEALTARALGEKLGSTPRPIFTVFNSMDEVVSEVIEKAKSVYAQYIENGLAEKLPFKGVGKAYIRFAKEQPKLFQRLFMYEVDGHPDVKNILGLIDESFEKILKSIEVNYNLSSETSLRLYRHLWIYSHGIAVLLATNVCNISDGEIDNMLTEVFISMLKNYLAGDRK